MNKVLTVFIISVAFVCHTAVAQSQPATRFFSTTSPADTGSKEYGTVTITAGPRTTIINTVMAYGENVKDLFVKMPNGFVFKLAPAQQGLSLNYVGNGLGIVLQPFQKLTIAFTAATKTAGLRQLYVSGQEQD
jgi:hypothetical protein